MNRRSILSVSATIALGLALLGNTAGSTARAAEIKLLCAVALNPAIDALIPDFEKSSRHKVTVAYGTAGAVADRVQKGEVADIVINSVPMIDRLQAQGKVVAGSRVIIAKVGVGVFVRKGAVKPDISSADAFKRSMLAARSIAYPDPAGGGASGVYVASLRRTRWPAATSDSELHPVRPCHCYWQQSGWRRKALLTFLSSAAAQTVLKAKGFD